MDGGASLYAVTFCSFCKGRLVPVILNTCLKTHQKKAKLLLVVLCSGLYWRASWQLASRVRIKHCKADRIIPLCTYFLRRMPRSSGLSLLPIGEVPFTEHGTRSGYPNERFFFFFLSSTRTLQGLYLIIGHNYFPAYPSQLVFHFSS